MRVKYLLVTLLPLFLIGSFFYKQPAEILKAENLAREGKLDEALKIYEKLSHRFAKRGDFQFDWALLYLKKKKFSSALDHFRLAFGDGNVPKDILYYNIGKTFELMRKYNDAVEMYKQALLQNPHNERARFNLELLLRRAKKGKRKQANKPKSSAGKMKKRKMKKQKMAKGKQKKKQSKMGDKAILQSITNRPIKFPPLNQHIPEEKVEKDW